MILTALQKINVEEGSILLINKPLRWTSFDVINKLKYEIKTITGHKKIKIGHAGTLDPLATGLLIVCVGKFTKKIAEFQNLDKRYTGTFTVGATTKSYDLEHLPENFLPYNHLTLEDVKKACAQLTGDIFQTPPAYSAIKLKGKSAFEYARQNKEINLKPKKVTIFSFDITRFSLPEIDFEIHCSKGTYIRSIANDLGKTLGCGAYLSSLCRTQIGSFNISEAHDFSPLINEDKIKKNATKKRNFEL
ncbi:MAG TPA: tRNA pseudouridine(55) synthase TruB [Bacteroidales bacterium]|nr:tRNA pseudouridine(55) synthase TruB [Bacteroidales bacterium]HON21180.1 tRNA pseudouridine(55) synthase TruB [Bacteroidales bacterium]HOR81296.1 tRNA pseudouridine(55) synthase TruB [Bacteroidales bacterium]HPJ90563.1 tRNA pseudouridine(55) synthase TruB [Bacteroidales bacterium]HQB20256.1 tRNA pseudouridine(55) synthase TruB [Bacteroidales bacterium]